MPENEKDYDGIVGMSLTPADSRLGAYPIFFNSLYQAKAISKPQFSYYITPGDAGGQVIFGGYDKSLMANPDDTITWVSVVDDTYMDNVNDLTFRAEGAWALPITRISSTIDGLSYSFPAKSGVIMDTGTSLGVIPATFLKRMVGLMRARKEGGSYIVPCSAKNDYVVPVPFKTTSGSIVTLCIIGFEEVADNLANIGFAFAKGRQPVFGGGASINGTGTGNVLSVTLPASGSSPSPSSSRKMYMSPSVKGAAMVVGILTLASSIGSL
ncbi:aspartic peptidase domain-containing protein [Chytridium lagenaria]|nr:aspartic peptidase domain-containing protein [Chytridium lagenaria]